MAAGAPSLETLSTLATSPDVRDRAFAASSLGLLHRAERDERVLRVYERIRETASTRHSAIRAQIRDRTLDKRAFIAELRAQPIDVRDHWVEEILGVAYPAVSDPSQLGDATRSLPSSVSEILFVVEHAHLGPERTFVDLGSGLGKVVLLVALLTGARCYGVELEPELLAHTRAAALSLGLDNVQLIAADLRRDELPRADAYYMFIPLLRSGEVVARLAPSMAEGKVQLFSQRLDLERLPWLHATSLSSYWLELYETR